MNERQIQLVQESFAAVEPMADVATKLFYGRLFELDPMLQPCFKANLGCPLNKPMILFTFMVMNLDRPDRLLPFIYSLGRQFARAGMKTAQCKTIEAALQCTLAQLLQEQFTPEVAAAWSAACACISKTMLKASSVARCRTLLRNIRARFRHEQSFRKGQSV